MKKIINDKGEADISVGEVGSKAWVKVKYPALIERVFEKMKRNYNESTGIYCKTGYSEIEMICHDREVTDAIVVGHIACISQELLNNYLFNSPIYLR